MKVLVTGGAGFIGSNLIRRLLKEGDEVICMDNLLTGSLDNISFALEDERFRFIEHDVIEPYEFDVDQIYNLACPASPVNYQKDSVHTIRTSFLGAYNALCLAEKTGARVLQTSTSEVYGEPLIHPQHEGYWGNVNPVGIRSCYDEGKRAAETLFLDFHRQYGTDVRIARIFNTYGPAMDPNDGRVIPNFIYQALAGKDLTVYGDGSQTRSFCYVDDTVEALIRLMNTDDPEMTGPINIGNPAEYTVLEVAEKIIAETGSQSRIVFKDLPEDDPTRRRPDISLAKEKLGWEPLCPFEQGIKKTIEYFAGIL